MYIIKKYRDGFTLIELLIALLINFILLTALISVFSANMNEHSKASDMNSLNQQLQTALQIMINDIRRAGYWSNAYTTPGTGVNSNPFMASGTDITVSGSCILFTYDASNNGSLPSISATYDDERYGYRLNSQALQARPPGAAFDCAAAATAWENITNTSTVQITNLTFTLNKTRSPLGATSDYIEIRSVDISITGRLTKDTTVTRTLTQRIKVRNDRFYP